MVVPLYSQDILNAISQGDLDRIKELIEENPELVKTRQGSRYPLHFAVLSRKKDIAEFLISKGVVKNEAAWNTKMLLNLPLLNLLR